MRDIRPVRPTIVLTAAAMLAAAGTGGAARAADGRPFTAHDLVTLDRLSEPALSPDGHLVAFTVRRTDLAADRGVRTVSVAPVGTTSPAPSPTGAAPDSSSPSFAPDGGSLYVLSKRGGSAQVWRLSLSGAAPVQVTHLPLDVGSFRVVPGGHALLVSMAVFPDAEAPEATRRRLDAHDAGHATGRVYDRMFVRHWDEWADGTRNHLFRIALDGAGHATGEPVALMPGLDADVPGKPFGDRDDYTIGPDGRSVFFSARIAGRTEPWSTNFDIFEVPADGSAKPRDLTPSNPATDSGPAVSPDGTMLAWRAMKRPGFEADRYGVMVMDLRHGGPAREIDPHWDRSAQSLLWSSDGTHLLVTAEDVQQTPLFSIAVADGRVTPLTGDGHVSDAVRAGTTVVYARDALDRPSVLWRMGEGGGPATQVADVDQAALAGVALAKWHGFTFAGWHGDTVHGIMVEPDRVPRSGKVPVVFLIHGGPQGSFGNDWSYRWNPQFYSGLGYASVMVDFHGSTGYGQAFTDAISGHWGDRPLEDLQKGWAAALAKFPVLDPGRACALGASYGGFMVNWIAGNWNGPWKCLVTHDGVFDDRMMGFATEELWFAEWEHGGPGHTPWADPAAYERFNPAAHVASWQVPQLVIHGEKDYRIPVEQGLAAFDALQRRNIESRLLVFPNENHWVLKPGDSLQWHATVANWLALHLTPHS